MIKVEKVKLVCGYCKGEYLVHPYRAKVSRFCSASCHGKYRVAQNPQAFFRDKHGEKHPMWGKHHSEETKKKMADRYYPTGEDHHSWIGDRVGYAGIHDWIENVAGKPQKCDKCGSTEIQRYEWANRSRQYKRDISDWIRLCVFCHRKADYYQSSL